MIQPNKITDFNRSDDELLEFFIFCVFVAGHSSENTAKSLEYWITNYVKCNGKSLKDSLIKYSKNPYSSISMNLKQSGIGCYTRHSRFIEQLGKSLEAKSINFRTATVEKLQEFIGVGFKTSRFFILHSRPGINNIAVLDRHILSFLREKGVDAPKNTPSSHKKYKELEKQFIRIANESDLTLSQFDLSLWEKKSNSK